MLYSTNLQIAVYKIFFKLSICSKLTFQKPFSLILLCELSYHILTSQIITIYHQFNISFVLLLPKPIHVPLLNCLGLDFNDLLFQSKSFTIAK